jgi:hypothetical protein
MKNLDMIWLITYHLIGTLEKIHSMESSGTVSAINARKLAIKDLLIYIS